MNQRDAFARRLAVLQSQLQPHQACLIATPTHITYLTNFHFLVPEEKEALLIITGQKTYLIHASFCPVEQVTSSVVKLAQTHAEALKRHISNILQENPGLIEWCVDENFLSVAEYKILQTYSNLIFKTFDHQLVWNLRMIKDKHEQRLCQQAARISYQAFEQLRPHIKTGLTEQQIKELLEKIITNLGADQTAFPTIVAFGDHSAIPHHQPGPKKLTTDTPVLIDFGAMVNGYRSDMTRTFWFGNQPSAEFLQIKETVSKAYQRAINFIKPALTQVGSQNSSLKALDLDYAAREVINQAGFNQEFIHTTGHGIGLDIHEPPSLNWKNDTIIKPGMIITIEPGIYLNGKFGYRYENTVLVTPTSALELTT